MATRIVRNSAHCKTCDTELESLHRHDFKECPCGNVFVDGGAAYIRHGVVRWEDYEDTSIHQQVL